MIYSFTVTVPDPNLQKKYPDLTSRKNRIEQKMFNAKCFPSSV